MCTRYTGAIDDCNPTHSAGELPVSEYTYMAYNLMANRPDRKKRVVIRRDFAFGAKPIKFSFVPTVTVDESTLHYNMYGGGSTAGGPQMLSPSTRILRRKKAPWMPFYTESFVDGSSRVTQLNTNVNHHGMAIAMRPRSCSGTVLPTFDVKYYLDLEFRGPRIIADASIGGISNASYHVFPDTYGDGTMG